VGLLFFRRRALLNNHLLIWVWSPAMALAFLFFSFFIVFYFEREKRFMLVKDVDFNVNARVISICVMVGMPNHGPF